MRSVLFRCMCVILSVSVAGCATMFNGATQTMSIRSNMEDAKLYVNETYIGTGNGTETFRKKGQYTITARKEGCRETSITPKKSFDPTTLLGILIDWGIISILVVDGFATGAITKYDKTGYLVDPDCSTPSAATASPAVETKSAEQPAEQVQETK